MPESVAVMRTWRSEGRSEGFAEGMAVGMLEARRAAVLRGIQLRFQSAVPADLSAQIRGAKDLDLLGQWLDAVLLAPDLNTFRGMLQRKLGA